jgi:hypothetical protein
MIPLLEEARSRHRAAHRARVCEASVEGAGEEARSKCL